MATIYRFIVEEGKGKGSGGRKSGGNSKKGTAKRYNIFSMLGEGNKGGVEHNRKLRAINPLLNRATGGWFEKGMRLGRAGAGLVQFKKKPTGGYQFAGLSGTAIAIIIAFAIQMLLKWQSGEIQRANMENKQNFKRMETGRSAIHGNYSVANNVWNGKISYNENK